MGTIKVPPEELKQISSQLGRGADRVRGELDSLRGPVQSLVDGQWEGSASARFKQLWEEWVSSAQKIHEALTGMGTFLSQAADAYEKTDTEIGRAI